jgi:hypothetical protein
VQEIERGQVPGALDGLEGRIGAGPGQPVLGLRQVGLFRVLQLGHGHGAGAGRTVEWQLRRRRHRLRGR